MQISPDSVMKQLTMPLMPVNQEIRAIVVVNKQTDFCVLLRICSNFSVLQRIRALSCVFARRVLFLF
jgi:hypothetical protein